MKIYILTLNGVFDTGLAAVQDSFAIADDVGRISGLDFGGFDSARVGVGGAIHTSHGLQVPVLQASNLPCPDVVVVPGIGAKTPDQLALALEGKDTAIAGSVLRSWYSEGATIAAACTATFVLAESGLLDGKSSTTSWWLGPFFRSRYPAVHVDDSKMLIQDGRLITAGAALAHFDLALWVIRQSSPAIATLTAKYLITEPRMSQASYVIPNHLTYNDPVVERFENWVRQNLATSFSIQSATKAIGSSPRTLARKTKRVLGKSPLAYVQAIRVEQAVHLLQTTKEGVDEIALKVGYADSITLRALLRRKTGRSVGEIRKIEA